MLTVAVGALWALFFVLTTLVVLLYRQFGLLYIGSRARVEETGLAPGKRLPLSHTVDLGEAALALREVLSLTPDQRGSILIFGGPGCELCNQLVPQLDEFQQTQPEIKTVYIDRSINHRWTAGGHSWVYGVSQEGALHDAMDAAVSPFAFVADRAGVVAAKGLVNTPDDLRRLIETAALPALAHAVDVDGRAPATTAV